MSVDQKEFGRLALRVEGDWWVAYYAQPDTMEDAIELGRIRMAIAQEQVRKLSFMSLMQTFIDKMIYQSTGVSISWPDDPVAAPEHERAGRS